MLPKYDDTLKIPLTALILEVLFMSIIAIVWSLKRRNTAKWIRIVTFGFIVGPMYLYVVMSVLQQWIWSKNILYILLGFLTVAITFSCIVIFIWNLLTLIKRPNGTQMINRKSLRLPNTIGVIMSNLSTILVFILLYNKWRDDKKRDEQRRAWEAITPPPPSSLLGPLSQPTVKSRFQARIENEEQAQREDAAQRKRLQEEAEQLRKQEEAERLKKSTRGERR